MMKKDFSVLIGAYFDATLTEKERRELESALRADAALMEEFLKLNEQEALLKTLAGRTNEESRVKEIILELKYRTASPAFARGVRSTLASQKSRRPLFPTVLQWAALVVISMSIGLLWHATRMPEANRPVLSAVLGDVSVVRNNVQTNLVVGDALVFGDQIHTGTGASVTLRYPHEETEIVVGESTVTVFPPSGKGSRIVLLREGKITCQVAPQAAGSSFQVVTPYHQSKVIGTRFDLEVRGDSDIAYLSVASGVVEVSLLNAPGSQGIRVSGGQQITLVENMVPQPMPQGSRQALLLGASTPETTEESLIRSRLTSLGFEVIPRPHETPPAFSNWDRVNLLVLSPSVSAADLHDEWRDAPVPFVTGDMRFLVRMGYPRSSFGEILEEAASPVDGSLHDKMLLPERRDADGFIVVTGPDAVINGFRPPSGMLVMLEHYFSTPRKAAMGGFESGLASPAGTLPAKRLLLFFNGRSVNTLTEDGWLCFDAGIRWVMAE